VRYRLAQRRQLGNHRPARSARKTQGPGHGATPQQNRDSSRRGRFGSGGRGASRAISHAQKSAFSLPYRWKWHPSLRARSRMLSAAHWHRRRRRARSRRFMAGRVIDTRQISVQAHARPARTIKLARAQLMATGCGSCFAKSGFRYSLPPARIGFTAARIQICQSKVKT